jgi:hypothetical protein
MRLLTVRHVTRCHYSEPVRLVEHRMMFRPRESHDLRLVKTSLDILPRPAVLRWLHDVFDNSVAIAAFGDMSSELRFDSTVTLDFDPTNSIVGNRNLIRVAVAWDPGQALPLWGSFIGSASSFRGMDVEVSVTEENGASLHTRHDRLKKD